MMIVCETQTMARKGINDVRENIRVVCETQTTARMIGNMFNMMIVCETQTTAENDGTEIIIYNYNK